MNDPIQSAIREGQARAGAYWDECKAKLALFPALTRALEELFDVVNLDKDDPKRLVAIKNAGGVLLQVRGLEE